MRPFPTPTALYQRQSETEDWVLRVTEIAQLAQREDESALAMGDRLVELERRYGPASLPLVAAQAGVSLSCVHGRHRVARLFPPEHPVRKLPLTFSHLRSLLEVEDPLLWARKVTEGQWSTRRLRDELEQALGQQARSTGERCRECREPLTDHWVALQRAGERRVRCCSAGCAIAYLRGRPAGREPFS